MMKKAILILFSLSLLGCKSNVTRQVQTGLVKKGVFSEELIEQGTLKALNSIAINAPTVSYRYGGLKITNFVEDGKEVKKGDTLLVFDQSEIKKSIVDYEQRMMIANAELEKLKATQQSEIFDLESDLEITRISFEITKINFDQSLYESEITKKEIKLKLDNAQVALDRAREQIENRIKIQQEDIFQKNLSIKQAQDILDEGNNSIKNLCVTSPSPGIAIREYNWMTDMKWQVGDQPYSGTKLIELPDLSVMTAEVKINEVDVSKIVPGLKAIIRSDSYSDTSYIAEITSVANLAQKKDYNSMVKVFPVTLKIHGKPENLLPGLTVSCKITISEIPDVLYIPLEAIFRELDLEFVYLNTVSGFERRNVKTGASNTDFVIITEGLKEGDEIALADPFLNKEEEKKE